MSKGVGYKGFPCAAVPLIGLNSGSRGADVDEIPGGMGFLDRAARIEDDRQTARTEVGDGMAMGVAMEVEADVRMAFDESAETLAIDEAMLRLAVLEEGEVVEEKDRIVCRQ